MSDYTPTTEEVRTDYVVAYTNAESSQLLAGMAFDRWIAQHDADVRAKALHEAAEFVDSQRYIDEPADLRQVRDRLHGLADGTWEVEAS